MGNRRLNREQKDIDNQIEWAKKPQGWMRKLPCESQEYIAHLREIYHEVPKAIARGNDSRRHINEDGLRRLDARIGKALDKRGVATLVGAENLCIDFHVWNSYEANSKYYGYLMLEYEYAWYGPLWLKNLAGTGDRSKFYRRFEKLKKEGKDAIDSEIGMMILGEV
jgi:hypothetical protein